MEYAEFGQIMYLVLDARKRTVETNIARIEADRRYTSGGRSYALDQHRRELKKLAAIKAIVGSSRWEDATCHLSKARIGQQSPPTSAK